MNVRKLVAMRNMFVINDKSQDSIIAQPSIKVMTGYFITNLSLNFLVKEFFKSVNSW